ncbi:hypothetical protein AP1_0400 [Aeromonas phage AP1]|nr:hypothetical protein AP1_0400 [Aeromonas phage AP1]
MNFEKVKSNRKFWNHTIIDVSGAKTRWGKDIQRSIKGK